MYRMFNKILTVVGILVLGQLVSADLFTRKKPIEVKPMEKIGDYLSKVLPDNDDLDQNMEAASKWKESLDRRADKAVIEALSTLEELHRVVKTPLCDQKMYMIVSKSAQLVGHKIFDLFTDKSDINRSKLIVRSATHRISKFCRVQHQNVIAEKLASLNSEQVRRAKSLSRYDVSFPLMVLSIMNRMILDDNPEFKYLKLVSDETGKKAVKKNEAREVVEQYITGPCNYLERELGDQFSLVIKNFDYDYVFSRKWLKETRSPLEDLTQTYCLCNIFTRAGEENVIKKFIELIPRIGIITYTPL